MDYPTKVRLSIQKLPLKQRKKHPYVYHFSSKREARKVTTEYHTRLRVQGCLLYTSDAADEEDSVDLGGRRIIKAK